MAAACRRVPRRAGRGVSEAAWRESKVACCLTLHTTKAQDVDPQPEPPSKFLEPTEAARLASDVKRRSRPAVGTERRGSRRRKNRRKGRRSGRNRRNDVACGSANRTRVRTVVATMENSETFGWQVAAEVHRRGLDRAKRKACVCDGQAYNWSIYEMHLLPAGFIAILDFVHLLAYLYDAAHAFRGSDAARGWKTYEQWLRWAWSGKVGMLLSSLRAAAAKLAAKGSAAAARKQTVDETLTYVTNNRQRMNYPEYRRLGLPVSSAPVESTIKQINRRVKGSEKFWLAGGAEAILQLRAAQLSQDDRWTRNWSTPSQTPPRRRLRPARPSHLRRAGTGMHPAAGLTISTGAVCGVWVNCLRGGFRSWIPRKEHDMKPSPQVPPEELFESMKDEIEQYVKKVMEAVNQAPDGEWLAGSEERVRDLSAEMRRRIFECAVQKRVDAAEAAFSPSAASDNGKAFGQ